mmetsp:Transcript_121239/g.350126  ORF Transcript_121239/g.350126 Transcript_121239/m.350126 type:complete len:209 (-) Transcript_121239:149-775(-)
MAAHRKVDEDDDANDLKVRDGVERARHNELQHRELFLPHATFQKPRRDQARIDEQHEQIPPAHLVYSEAVVQCTRPLRLVAGDVECAGQRRSGQRHDRPCESHGHVHNLVGVEDDVHAKTDRDPIDSIPEAAQVQGEFPMVAMTEDFPEFLEEQHGHQREPDHLRDVVRDVNAFDDRNDAHVDLPRHLAVVSELERRVYERVEVRLQI